MGAISLIAGSVVGFLTGLAALLFFGIGWGTAFFIYFGVSIAAGALFLGPIRIASKNAEVEDPLEIWREELGFHPDGKGPITLRDRDGEKQDRRAA